VVTDTIAFFTRESSYCSQRVLTIAILSVCPSVRLSVIRVDQSKTVQVITKSSLSTAWKYSFRKAFPWPVESHSGARETFSLGPRRFQRTPLGKFFWVFLSKIVHSGVLYISGRRRPPTWRRRARGSLNSWQIRLCRSNRIKSVTRHRESGRESPDAKSA